MQTSGVVAVDRCGCVADHCLKVGKIARSTVDLQNLLCVFLFSSAAVRMVLSSNQKTTRRQ